MESAINTMLHKGYQISLYPKDSEGDYRVSIRKASVLVADNYEPRASDALLRCLADMVPSETETEEEEVS